MRVAALYDIHGNLDALDAALDAARQSAADLVQRLELLRPARDRLVQACILDRDGDLPRRGAHDLEIARFVDVFALVAHGCHDTSGLAPQEDRSSAK